jgi:hypothetical protein
VAPGPVPLGSGSGSGSDHGHDVVPPARQAHSRCHVAPALVASACLRRLRSLACR